jgi:hypothetical protein
MTFEEVLPTIRKGDKVLYTDPYGSTADVSYTSALGCFIIGNPREEGYYESYMTMLGVTMILSNRWSLKELE